MKTRKKISIILLIIWSILTILILTFGSGVSRRLINGLSNYFALKHTNPPVVVTDLEISTLDCYLIDTPYQLAIQSIPSTEEDLQLEFKSLNEEVFTVNSGGQIRGIRTNQMYTTGILEITSKKFPQLSKQVTLHFQKIYPDDVSILLSHKVELDTKQQIFVDVPFYVYYQFECQNGSCTETKMEVEFDQDFLERQNEYKFVAKKTGKTKLVFNMNNGDEIVIRKEIELDVQDVNDEEKKITDIQLTNEEKIELIKENKTYTAYVGEKGILQLLYNETVSKAGYHLASSDPSVFCIDDYDDIYFVNAGKACLTITTDDQEVYPVWIEVKNDLCLPEINELENEKLYLKDEEQARITYQSFNRGIGVKTSLEFDNQYITTIFIENQAYQIRPIRSGTTTMKVIVDDGVTHLEKEYIVEIAKNHSSKKAIHTFFSVFISKFVGHLGLFFMEALFALWVLSYYHNKICIKLIIFTLIGFALGAITEWIQYFIPGRNGCMEDVAFDMIVYALSGAVVYAIIRIRKNKKRKEKQN